MPQQFFIRSRLTIVRPILCIALLAPVAVASARVPTAAQATGVPAVSSQAAANSASVFYKFDVVAQSGQDNLTGMGDIANLRDL